MAFSQFVNILFIRLLSAPSLRARALFLLFLLYPQGLVQSDTQQVLNKYVLNEGMIDNSNICCLLRPEMTLFTCLPIALSRGP